MQKITQYSIQKKISTYQIPSICLPMDTSAEKITNSWCDACTDFTTLINVYVDVRLRCNKLARYHIYIPNKQTWQLGCN